MPSKIGNVLYFSWLFLFLGSMAVFASSQLGIPFAAAAVHQIIIAVIFIATAPVIIQVLSHMASQLFLKPDKRGSVDEEVSWYYGRLFWIGMLTIVSIVFLFYFMLFGMPYLFFGKTISEMGSLYLPLTMNLLPIIPLWTILPLVYLFAFYGPFIIKIFIVDVKFHLPGSLRGITFDDIIGQDQAIRKIKTILLSHARYEDFKKLGGKPRFNMIFTGPPGVGKTHTARAIAATKGKPFIEVLPSITYQTFVGVDIIALWIVFVISGVLSWLFGGSYVFFDEFENLGRDRKARFTQMASGTRWFTYYIPFPMGNTASGATTLLLSKLSSVGANPPFWYLIPQFFFNMVLDAIFVATFGLFPPPKIRTNVLNGFLNFLRIPKKFRFPDYILLRLPPGKIQDVTTVYIGATNLPEFLDEAIRTRPERFQFIEFETPGIEERLQFVNYYLDRKKIPHNSSLDDSEVRQDIARMAEGFSFDQLEQVFQSSLQDRFVRTVEKNQAISKETVFINIEDIADARNTLKHGFAKPTRTTRESKEKTAYHEAGHLVAQRMFGGEEYIPIHFSAISRGRSLGRIETIDEHPHDPHRQEFYEYHIRSLFASHAAERMFFGENTAGVVEDLSSAAIIACKMLSWGMWPYRDKNESDEDWKRYKEIGSLFLTIGTSSESSAFISQTISIPERKDAVAIILGRGYVDGFRCVIKNKEALEQSVKTLKESGWEMSGGPLREFYLALKLNPIEKSDPWPEVYIPNPFYRNKDVEDGES